MSTGIKSVLVIGLNKISGLAVIVVIITLALMLVVVQGFIGSNIFAMVQQGPIKLFDIVGDRDQVRFLGQNFQDIQSIMQLKQLQQNSNIATNATSDLLDEANTLNAIFKAVEKSIVTITRTLPSPTIVTPEAQNITVLGSGFVYDNQGHIITNNHVVGNAKVVNVLFENGDRFTAKVIGGDTLNDIAVLKIIDNITQLPQQQEEKDLRTPLLIGNSSKLEIGQPVIAIGNPFRLENTMTTGIVSQTGRLIPEDTSVEQFLRLHFPWVAFSIPSAIQTDAPINPGNSGGPLLNMQGQVIGMNTAAIGSNGIGFAIPSNAIFHIVPTLIAKGNYTHPYLGLALDTSPSAIAEDYKSVPANLNGVFVNAIEKGGPADKAGLHGSSLDQYYQRHSGDMIVAIDGHNVTKAEEFISYIDEHKTPGNNLNLTVYRDGKMLYLTANLKPWPSLVPFIRQIISSSYPE
ncbi:MAG: trypsin-like peptidase domain-containing protein [Candidatus Nitrosopolaris sp.]